MSFIDSLLLDCVAYGFSGGPTWSTTRVTLASGMVRRNAERERPVYRYTAPFNNLKQEQLSVVVQAFNTCLGGLHSFRFFDRMDYLLDDAVIGTADGSAGQEIQLVKPYTFGAQTINRPIKKPVDSMVDYGRGERTLGPAPAFAVTANGSPIAFTLDYTTGIVTLTGTAGHVIRASGWFDVPVYFEHDALNFALNNKNAHSTDVDLTEDLMA